MSMIFQAKKMPNIHSFSLLKCENHLLVFVIYDCKLNISGFLTDGQKKQGF